MLVEKGETNKIFKSTQFNISSSRSHTILEICIRKKGTTKESVLTLCDLAGSEKFTEESIKDKSLMAESKNINRSLSTLTRYQNS